MANNDTDLRCYLTNAGIAAENNAIALGRKLPIKEMVFGSGVLADSEDPRNQTAMLNEQFKVPCAMVTHDDNVTLLTFKGDIPVDVGGFNINEVAIRLEDGTIYGYARGAGDYKPTPEQGATESIRYVVDMYSTNVSVIECKVDLSSVYADYEDLNQAKVEAAEALQAHKDHDDPHPQYATDDDLNQAMQQAGTDLSNLISISQFLPYDETRKYKTGEICYTKDQVTNELSYWQWYSNVESLAGKSPLLEVNRHVGWSDNTKPFYWVPYTGEQVGMPFFWLDNSAPEWAVMEINVDLPIAVYWRLARRYPSLVNGSVINTGEIRAAALRVLDQGRGVDAGRLINSEQLDAFQMHSWSVSQAFRHGSYGAVGNEVDFEGTPINGNYIWDATAATGDSNSMGHPALLSSPKFGGTPRVAEETRMRNVARPMAIAI